MLHEIDTLSVIATCLRHAICIPWLAWVTRAEYWNELRERHLIHQLSRTRKRPLPTREAAIVHDDLM